MSTWCRYHCRACGSHFTSVEAFEAHHEGSGESLRPCVFPDDSHLVEERFGVCKIADPTEPARGVIVHRLVREGKYGAAGRQPARGRLREAPRELVAA